MGDLTVDARYSVGRRWRYAWQRTVWFSLRYDIIPSLLVGAAPVAYHWREHHNDANYSMDDQLVPLLWGLGFLVVYFLGGNAAELTWKFIRADDRLRIADAAARIQALGSDLTTARAEARSAQAEVSNARSDLDRYRDSLPNIVMQGCYEDQNTTPWYKRHLDGHLEHRADSFFTHIYFVNRPAFPSSDSRAENVTAYLEVFKDGRDFLAWYGRWANTPENPPQRDPRQQRRIDIDPDGQPVSLDVTIRNPGAYTVYGYNDESRSHDRGFDENKVLPPGEYVVKVTLQGVRVPATPYWLDLAVGDTSQVVQINQRSTAGTSLDQQ